MPLLVHIAPEPLAARIRRHGLGPRRIRSWIAGHDRFVWAFPVLESYTLTHQWMRELKRRGTNAMVAVTFRVPDDEPVLAGHYNDAHRPLTAAKAVGHIRALADPRGAEIMVPRRIEPREIVAIRALPKGIGWRYWPGAKATDRWPCECPMCLPRGEPKARRYRDRIGELQSRWEARDAVRRRTASDRPA